MKLQTKGFLTLGVFTAAFLAVLILPASAQAQTPDQRRDQLKPIGSCGTVQTGSPHDYAGLIVVLGAIKSDGGGAIAINEGQRSDGASVTVSTGPGSLSDGNVVKLDYSRTDNELVGERDKEKTFGPRELQGSGASCTGQLVLPGYGSGNWAIDCDVSKRGLDDPQKMEIQGKGTPYVNGKKLVAGGTWTTDEVAPPNGTHRVAITTYHEPDNPTKGWKADAKSKVNHTEINIQYETPDQYVSGLGDPGPKPDSDTKPYYWNSPDDKRDCSDYTAGGTNYDRCRSWNDYNNQVWNKEEGARAHNQAAAEDALSNVQFRHKIANVGGNSKDKWITASVSSQVYAKAVATNSPSPSRANNGSLGDSDWQLRNDWQSKDYPANGSYLDAPGGQSPHGVPNDATPGLTGLLNNPRTGDQYCEYLHFQGVSSTNGSADNGNVVCVKFSAQNVDQCDDWQVHSDSYIDGPRDPGSAWVGDTFTAHYSFWKTGVASQTQAIQFLHNGGSAGAPFALGSWDPAYNLKTVTAQDGGTDISDSVTYSPDHSDPPGSDCGSAGGGGQSQKISVPWFYQLHPQVNINDDTPDIVQQGTPAKIDPLVVLNGNDADRSLSRWNTCANEFDWQLKVTAQKPDTPTVKEGLTSYDRSGHKNARDICPNGNPGSAQSIGSGSSVDTTNLPAGTKLCGELTINKSTENDGSSASVEKCTVIVKAPKVQFWDSDVRVGVHFQQADNNPTCGEQLNPPGNAGITTVGPPTSVANQNLYGSWVEYGAFASGGLSSFGSAAENKTGSFDVSPTGQRLTFGNDSQLGQFAYSNWCIPDYEKLYQQQQDQTADTRTGSTIDLSELDANHYYTATAGDIILTNLSGVSAGKQDIIIDAPNANVTLQGGNVQPGVRLVIHAKGTVKVNGNIKYNDTGGYGNIGDIPRVVIIADGQLSVGDDQQGIEVNDNVTQIDAWLVTSKGLYTCTTKPAGLTYSGTKCGDKLTMNGPVAVNTLHLRRTFGADLTKPLDERGPGEVFNLNPGSLLSSYSAAQRNYFVDVYQSDAPPRY